MYVYICIYVELWLPACFTAMHVGSAQKLPPTAVKHHASFVQPVDTTGFSSSILPVPSSYIIYHISIYHHIIYDVIYTNQIWYDIKCDMIFIHIHTINYNTIIIISYPLVLSHSHSKWLFIVSFPIKHGHVQ